MKIKFTDIVKITPKACTSCFILLYMVPCEIKEDIVPYMSSFGNSKFDLKTISLLQIESPDNYTIKGRLNNNYIKFSLPMKFKNTDLKESRKLEFENNLIKWLESRLDTSIV